MESLRSPSAPEGGWAECLDAARAGCPDALGRLLERFRPVLLAVAAQARDPALRAKAGESDLVQDSLLEGQQGFHAFRGRRPEELLAWLRQILAHNLANFRRHYRDAGMRDVRRESAFPASASAAVPGDHLADGSDCPAEAAARREEAARLEAAVERLPEPVRVVVVWRYRDGLSFEEIGTRLGRTPEGARQVWWRAVLLLRTQFVSRDELPAGLSRPSNDAAPRLA
jgi:RNA polymerase sigma-70 factor (ECF subfamily)